MQFSVRPSAVTEVFDDAQIVPSSGLLPVMALAQRAGLGKLTDRNLTLTGIGKANPAGKTATLIAALCTGANTISGLNVLRTGATGRLFNGICAPSTAGIFLRTMTEDNLPQWAEVAAGMVTGLAACAPLLTPARRGSARTGPGKDLFMIDIDDTVLPIDSNKEQVGHTYQRCQGLSVHLVTGSRAGSRPVILAQELRAGTSSGKPGGAADLITAALATTKKAFTAHGDTVLVRGDSAYYSATMVAAALAADANVAVGIKKFPNITALIDSIAEHDWEPIAYPEAVFDTDAQKWVSDAAVAEVPLTGFVSNRRPQDQQVPGRLIIRRVKIDAPGKTADPQLDLGTIAPIYRYHPVFTTLPATYSSIEVEQIYRGHAIIEQVNADLKSAALAHLPTAKFAANSTWVHLAAIAYNLVHAAAAMTSALVGATSASIRYKLLNVPARLTQSGHHSTLHLPKNWPWATARAELTTAVHAPPDTNAA